MLRVLGAGLAACCIAACALIVRHPQKLPDGSYRISCDAPLADCLRSFENTCEWHGYDVIAASETRRHTDLREIPSVVVTSEATLRCKQPEPLFGRTHESPQPAPAAPQSPVIAPVIAAPAPGNVDPMSASAPVATGPGPGPDAAVTRVGVRSTVDRSVGGASFDGWPA